MGNQNRRDARRRRLVQRYEVERRLYKAMSQDMGLPTNVRRSALLQLCSLPRNSSLVRVQNRCVVSGRARSVSSTMKLSRLCFREAAARGFLPGVFKSSW